jgi:hypothetical protein
MQGHSLLDATTFVDTDTPASGTLNVYRVTYIDDFLGIEGGMGKTSEGQQRPNLAPCP